MRVRQRWYELRDVNSIAFLGEKITIWCCKSCVYWKPYPWIPAKQIATNFDDSIRNKHIKGSNSNFVNFRPMIENEEVLQLETIQTHATLTHVSSTKTLIVKNFYDINSSNRFPKSANVINFSRDLMKVSSLLRLPNNALHHSQHRMMVPWIKVEKLN